MSSPQSFDPRVIAVVLVLLLSSLVMLGAGSEPPLVAVSGIASLEDGMSVQLFGILVDDFAYESGAESIVLADLVSPATVKVVSAQGAQVQPSQYANIGDELLVVGKLSRSGQTCTVYSKSDAIQVLRTSDQVLTVDLLLDNWRLFEGDCVRIKGVLGTDGLGISSRLSGPSGDCSVALELGGLRVTDILGSSVVVTAFVRFDYRVSALILHVESIVADG